MRHRERFDWLNGRFWLTVALSFVLTMTIAIGDLHPLLPSLSTSQNAIAQQLSWGRIFSGFRRSKPPHGSRGGVCILFPVEGEGASLIREIRPTFLWQGFAGKIALRRAGDKEAFWSKPIGGQPKLGESVQSIARQLRYDGIPLLPGETYEVLFYALANSTEPVAVQPFRVLSATEQTEMRTALTTLQTQLRADGASQETIALERANFFAQRQLWSDAAREVVYLKNSSPEWQQTLKEITTQLCRPSA
jgi:hypothetical protein